MDKIESFIKQMSKIEIELKNLENKYIDLYKDYEGNEFEFQNKIVSKFENITQMLTHEISSNIGFGISDIKLLIKFVIHRLSVELPYLFLFVFLLFN